MHRDPNPGASRCTYAPTLRDPKVWDRAVPNCRTAKNHPEQSQRVSARDWGIELLRIYVAAGRGILPRMTRHKHAQTGLGIPQLPQHWLTAALRMLAMLVLHVASTLQMKDRRASVNATPTTPLDLPRAKTDTQSKETEIAVQHDSLTSAHAEQRSYAARPSKHERVLTTLSQTPTPSVSLGSRQAIHLPQFSTGGGKPRTVATKGNLPPSVRSTGGGGSPRLRGETEGALAKPAVQSGSVNPVHAFPAKAGSSLRKVRATRSSSEPLT